MHPAMSHAEYHLQQCTTMHVEQGLLSLSIDETVRVLIARLLLAQRRMPPMLLQRPSRCPYAVQ